MRIKSYYANNIKEAISRARVELGPEAVIIASKRTTADKQKLGAYEVVLGVAESVPPAPRVVAEPAPPPVRTPPEGLERLRQKMEDLRQSVSKKREQASANRAAATSNGPRIVPALTRLGFSESVASQLARGAHGRVKERKQTIFDGLYAEIDAQLRVSNKFGVHGAGRSVVALAGTPGAGKTSTIVKLAVKYGLSVGRPTRLISTDTQRLGGTDLLARYARCMDMRIDTPRNLDDLERSLSDERRNELVLIDTPGVSRGSLASVTPLATWLAQRAGVETHLVLPAYASVEELQSRMTLLKPFFASKLILTGLDMCESVGPALAVALAAEMPVSYVSTGDVVPEDLEEASAASLAGRLLPILMEVAAAAA